AAVEFAFLLGVVTLTAASAYSIMKSGDGMLGSYGWPALLTGFLAAWVSAAVAVKWMVAWLNRHGLGLFAWWRFAAAALAAVLLLQPAPAGPASGPADAAAYDSVMNLVTRQASRPSMPSSEPWPLSFTPPKGASGAAIT